MGWLRRYQDVIGVIACLGMFWTLVVAGDTAIGDFTPFDIVALAAWVLAGPLSLMMWVEQVERRIAHRRRTEDG